MKAEDNMKVDSIKKEVEIDNYLEYFNEKIDNLNSIINELDLSIIDVKKNIKNTENELTKNLEEITKKNKLINSKLHDVSGDYDESDLIQAAEDLKELRLSREDLEDTANRKLDDLNSSLEKLEEDKKFNVLMREKSTEISSSAEKELKTVEKKYSYIFNAIEKAIDICDNNNLVVALKEEINNRNENLEDIENNFKEEINKVLNIEESKPQKQVEKEIEKPILEIKEEKKEINEKNKKVITIDTNDSEEIIPIEKKIKKTKMEIPEIKIDIPVEEKTDESRKVIDIKNISNEQQAAIENSSIVEKGLKNFFK